MEPARREAVIGYIAAAITVLIWASFIVASRVGLTKSTLTINDMMLMRFGVATVVLAPLTLTGGLLRPAANGRYFGGIGFWRAAFLAATAGFVFIVPSFYGFRFAPVSHAAVLLPGVLPLFSALVGIVLLRERPGTRPLVGLGLILAGVAALGYDSLGHSDIPGQWIGDLLFLTGSFLWAIYGAGLKTWKVEPLTAITIVSLLSLPPTFVMWWVMGDTGFARTEWHIIVAFALLQGVLSTIMGLFAYGRAVKALGPTKTAVLTSLTPGAATLLAIPAADEIPSLVAASGIVLAFIGMLVTVARR